MSPKDYTPRDLPAICNAGRGAIPPFATGVGRSAAPGAPLAGEHIFRGIPFQIGAGQAGATAAPPGAEDRPCVLRLAGADSAVRIAVGGQLARQVIFVHRQLDSRLLQGGPLGEVVAYYALHYADGSVARVPIRERFEIATVPVEWGQNPFLAVPDLPDSLPPRYGGDWGEAGNRLTEACAAQPHSYFLWAWSNPHPDRPIDAIAIEPAGPAFLLAAVTLGHLDEEPFSRAAARTVKLTLPDPADAGRPFGLRIEVDRGVATFPYSLPAASADTFLHDAMRGYGSAANQGSSPAYAEVAANPSATFSVALGDEVIGQVRWADLDAGRAIEPNPRLRVEVVDPGRNWVRTTVVDDATGRPIPCRVHFRSSEGVPYAPHGHHAHLNSELHTWHIDVGGDVRLGGVTYAYIDGHCEGWLPRGEVLVDVAHGFEYEPLRAAIQIAPGQQELTLRLKRWCDMNARHNYSGDTHVHFLSTQGAQLEMLRLPGNGGTVEVEADAESILPIPRLEIVQQGHVVAAIEERDGARHLRLRARLPIQGHTWLAERVAGPGYFGAIPHHDVWHRGIMAHTSPIYVAVGGEWDLYDPDVAAYMLTLLEGSLTYIRTRSRQYPPETVTHFHGQADHEAVLEGPFHEAVQALHARMHRLGIPH